MQIPFNSHFAPFLSCITANYDHITSQRMMHCAAATNHARTLEKRSRRRDGRLAAAQAPLMCLVTSLHIICAIRACVAGNLLSADASQNLSQDLRSIQQRLSLRPPYLACRLQQRPPPQFVRECRTQHQGTRRTQAATLRTKILRRWLCDLPSCKEWNESIRHCQHAPTVFRKSKTAAAHIFVPSGPIGC